MSEATAKSITHLLVAWSDGDKDALDQLVPLVEAELRRVARSYMRRERGGHTLQTTALVNEAYLRLIDQRQVRWQTRTHFLSVVAQQMRRILVDYARRRRYQKRGAQIQYTLPSGKRRHSPYERPPDLIALDNALSSLAEIDPRRSQVVE